jgi:hypothetical protein
MVPTHKDLVELGKETLLVAEVVVPHVAHEELVCLLLLGVAAEVVEPLD